MNHKPPLLTSRPTDGGIELVYQHPQPGTMHTVVLQRLVLGLHAEPPLGVVVVGERVLWHRQESAYPTRYFIVLDGWSGREWDPFVRRLLHDKDRYYARAAAVSPLAPTALDALRLRDGVLQYQRRPIGTYRQHHPHFVGTDHTLQLTQRQPPPEAQLQGQLALWLDEPAADPTGQHPLRDPTGEPLAQVQLPGNLPNDEVVAALRLGRMPLLYALWHGLHLLRTTPYWTPRPASAPAPRTPNPITGY